MAGRFLISALAAASAAGIIASQNAVTMSVPDSTPFADQLVYFTYQGLQNRNAAQVFLLVEGMLFWTDAAATGYFASNWLGPQKGYDFHNATNFCDMYSTLPKTVQGLALYNETELDASSWLAVTTAGLQDLLPIRPDMLQQPQYSCLQGLPVVVDYRRRFTDNLAAYDWGLANLMPSCASDLVYSAGHSFNDSTGYSYLGNDPSIIIGMDLAVSRRAFVFNLSPDTGKYAAQAVEWGKIVAALDPLGGRLLFGWAEPEPAMTGSTSLVGGAVVCDGAPNLSFWAHVSSSYPVLPYHSSGIELDKSKYYVSFQTNEGDTPKILAALQQGAWLDPRRGSVPIAWGLDPLVATFAPGLLEFYALTASANDTWFAGTAGAGYNYPWLMQPVDFGRYAARAGQLARNITQGWPDSAGGLWNIDIWDNNRLNNLTSYKDVAGDVVGLFTMQPEELDGSNNWLADGTPVVITHKALWYPCQNLQPAGYNSTLEGMQAAIRDVMAAHPPPFFFVVYGCLLDNSASGNNRNIFDYAIGMRDGLAGEGLVVVGAQDMARLARDAGPGRQPATHPVTPRSCNIITDCGAPTDNATDATGVIEACVRSCDTVIFPSGAWQVTSIDLSNTSGLTLEFQAGAALYASTEPDAYPLAPFFPPMGNSTCWRAVIFGRYVTGLTIQGPACASPVDKACPIIDGGGPAWWPIRNASSTYPPKLFEIVDGVNITLVGMHWRNSAMWHMHPIFCTGVAFHNLTVTTATRVPGGTDGIDPESCTDVLVDGCHIDVGDDGMAIKSGYHDVTGQLLPSANILIRNTTILSRNWAIGSACFGNITNITFVDSRVGDADGSSPWAIKIKSHAPRGGVVSGITLKRLTFGAIKPNTYQQPQGGMAISIYEDYGHPANDVHPDYIDYGRIVAAGHEAWAKESGLPPAPFTQVSDILFEDIDGLSAVWAGNPINGTPGVANVTRLTFHNVDFGKVSAARPWLCDNVNDTTVEGQVQPPPPADCGA